ncbi:hypothetical protein HGRIS_002038 [Hohenbuehelia grisea]|uniref:Uncharacterized protein n=1 Tax=Hohenbuehelia grisea TaxID=104357 RepID=A0ABR3JJX0_9AGAR
MKREHKPLARHRVVSGLAFTLILAAFLLMLLVSVSLPVVKSIYLLSVKADVRALPFTSVATELRFGVWGLCATSVLNAPTILRNTGECFGPKLGYEIPDAILDLVGISHTLAQAIQHSLLIVLVLHPIAAALSFLTLLSALCLGSKGQAICSLLLAIITALFSTAIMAVDVAFVLVARSKIKDLIGTTLTVNYGNAAWMVVGSVICSWLAVCVLAARSCHCCGVRKST